MKGKLILTIAMVFGLMLWGCEEQGGGKANAQGKVTLEILQGKICLHNGPQVDCRTKPGQIFRLFEGNNGPEIQTIALPGANKYANWSQFGKTESFPKPVSLELEKKGKHWFLKNENKEFKTLAGFGYLMSINPQGIVKVGGSLDRNIPRQRISFGKSGISIDGNGAWTQLDFGSMVIGPDGRPGQPGKDFLPEDFKLPPVVSIIEMIEEDENLNRIAAQDTGTEIVIEDVFQLLQNDCCEDADLSCCDGGGTVSPGTESESPGDGYTELRRIGSGEACIYIEGSFLVVIDCESQTVKCYGTTLCDITLVLNEDGSVSLWIPEDCDSFEDLTDCE